MKCTIVSILQTLLKFSVWDSITVQLFDSEASFKVLNCLVWFRLHDLKVETGFVLSFQWVAIIHTCTTWYVQCKGVCSYLIWDRGKPISTCDIPVYKHVHLIKIKWTGDHQCFIFPCAWQISIALREGWRSCSLVEKIYQIYQEIEQWINNLPGDRPMN